MPLTPKNRKEEWLQGLVDHETTLTPKNRPEEWMKEIIDASGGGGTGGGVLVCHIGENNALDKTWQEIKDAINDGKVITIAMYNLSPETDGEFAFIVYASVDDGIYSVILATISTNMETMKGVMDISILTTDSANGYPTF